MDEPVTPRDIDALYAWYKAMGVTDHAVDQPTDWFDLERQIQARRQEAGVRQVSGGPKPPARPVSPVARAPTPGSQSPPAAPSAPRQPAAPRRPVPVAPDAAVMTARSQAGSATTLAELAQTLQRFDGCGLKATAKSLCFYRGAERARLMLIGEAPGREEDLAGKPFVGRAGQLLDKMLAAIGLGEADVHITNVVYWRPPGNRTPTPQEVQVCEPFLERQIALVEPEIILLLGGAAAKQLLDSQDGIMRLRGKWRDLEKGGRRIKAIATLHPAYLLRTPNAKRQAWRDLLMVEAALRLGTGQTDPTAAAK
ncbi:MAG: uracil-DNA glycosylase family protein [Hyphomicrobiaceae bacterium]